jgi:hypothetical protein
VRSESVRDRRSKAGRREQSKAEHSKAEHSRARQRTAKQGEAEQNKAEHSKAGRSRAEQGRAQQGSRAEWPLLTAGTQISSRVPTPNSAVMSFGDTCVPIQIITCAPHQSNPATVQGTRE